MKKLLKALACTMLILPATFFMSCLTTSVHEETASTEIKAERFALNTYFEKDDYVVLGTATGQSDFVWKDSLKNTFNGDTGKYGYIYEPKETTLGEGIFVGTGKRALNKADADEALYRARLNANYELIQKTYELGGDSIFDPVYTVEKISDADSVSSKTQYKVTVRAKVIQFKTK